MGAALVASLPQRYRPIGHQGRLLPSNNSVNRTLTRCAGSRRLPQALGVYDNGSA